jgi:hypothetical protein
VSDARLDKLPQHEKKRKKPVALNGKTLEHFERLGIPAVVAERMIPYSFIKIDLFNIFDVLAIVPPRPARSFPRPDLYGVEVHEAASAGYILGVQITDDGSGGHVNERVRKIVAEPRARKWLEAGARIVVHGWAKRGKTGSRKLWTLREVPVTLADIENPAAR